MQRWTSDSVIASEVLHDLGAFLKGGNMEENESVERLWELAEETFECSKDSLNDAIEGDYQFTLDDLDKILPELAKRIFMMGFITGLESQLFDDQDDDNGDEIN
ncbi:MAG: hypothetical protein HKK67_06685 [Chlorobiaceae bacterium]|nr:hypothetical protein [Chlorobiaceae bacterium]